LSFLVFLALSAVLLAALLLQPVWRRWRQRRLRRSPFPAAWRAILRRRVPYLRRLPADLRTRLLQQMQVFLAEKPFLGCAGMAITDEVRLTIAALACLPLVNRDEAPYPELRQILVYPGPFLVERTQADGSGVLHDHRQVLAGESWSQGQVILSWQDVLQDAAAPEGGRNVVLHEFAHQLDQENGAANGAPVLGDRDAYARWSAVLSAEYTQLQQRTERGEDGLLDTYGASSPAEFFAVVTEAFFLQPQRLAREHAALFDELRRFYRIDPLAW
jgi:hypothetical protein